MTNNDLIDRSTDVVAASAVASPIWLPWLQQTSEVAGLLVPILGAAWLIVQIIGYMYRRGKK